MSKALIAKPYSVASLPNGTAVSPIVAQEEAPNALPCLPDAFDSNCTSPDQIAHGLVDFIRYPYSRQLAGTPEPREQDRIASVGLNTIAGAAWRVCRRDNLTHMAGCVDLTIEAVATGARFVDNMQFAISIAELLEHPSDGIGSVCDAAIEAAIT
jgi:hypothetical protein